MADAGSDPRASIDVQVNTPGREGLTGTAPADLYAPLVDPEQISVPPDFSPPDRQPAWRQDFPIDWPQDQYVERRDFMKFMVLTSFAFTIGQFWIGVQSWWRRRLNAPGTRRITSLDQIPVGGTLLFNYPDEHDPCVLIRLTSIDVVAYSQKCTHLSCAVVPRPEQGVLQCPCHDGLFDLQTGAVRAGPPRRPLPRIVLDVRGGEVYATGVEWRTS